MNIEEVDIRIDCSCSLKPIKPPSTAQEIELRQEETRINYYLHAMTKEIEKRIRSGQKIDMNFIEAK